LSQSAKVSSNKIRRWTSLDPKISTHHSPKPCSRFSGVSPRFRPGGYHQSKVNLACAPPLADPLHTLTWRCRWYLATGSRWEDKRAGSKPRQRIWIIWAKWIVRRSHDGYHPWSGRCFPSFPRLEEVGSVARPQTTTRRWIGTRGRDDVAQAARTPPIW
jgi:hypothetical protein